MKRFVSIISAIAMIFSMVSFDISIVQAEEYNGLIYSIENETVTITGANGLLTEIEIPSEIESYPVTAIASEAFYNSECRDVLESVTLPDSITSIGNAAFANCENLKTINIPEGITVLNEEVFRSCVNLKSLYLYETLTAFDYCAVGGCEFDYIFYEGSQSQFNKISLDKGCEQVADATIFYNCDHAHNFVDYVSNNNATCEADGTETVSCTECDVTHTRTATNSALGHSWTEWSTIVTATSESAGLEKRICTNDDSHVEYNVVYLKEYEGLTFDIENETAIVTGVIGMLTDIVIPDKFAGYTVTTIAEDAFYQSDCHTVMKTIVMPTSITNIGDMAFAKCDVLETIYYTGNESSFNKISIVGKTNASYIADATIVYNYGQHVHSWGAWSITKEPTQTETGTAERICGSNNQHIDSKEIASLSDETVWSKGEYISPTCTEAGAQKYVSEYGTVTEIIPAAHSWGVWSIATEPTKTTVGEAQRICSNDNSHIDTKELPVLTDTTVWTAGAYVAPACEVNGSQTYTSEYGTVVETIASIGHSWGEWTTTKEPTLTATGTAERICNNDSNHKETKEVATLENTTEFAGGRGTNTDPYKVSTPEHLNNVRNYLSAYFIQINEIDMTAATSEGGAYYNSGAGWKPIGTSDSSSTLFKGEYNGNGYAIKGLYCKGTLGGLFGYSSGTLKNIAMVDCDIIGTSTYTGSIVSYNKGTVQGCYTTGNVTTTSTSTSSRMGGLVGRSLTGSSIIDCYNIGTVSGGNGYVGGIVGYAEYTTINNCYNDATLTSTKATKMGGIVGYAYGSSSTKTTISNCYNLGKVSSSYTSAYLGGIAGDSYYTTIETCFNKGVLDSTSKYSGGISGYGNYVTISQCLNEAKITNATSYMGGIIGYFARGDINDCYNTGLVNKAAGAIAGYGASSSYAKITNCYNSSTAVANTLASGSYKVTTSYNIVTDSKATVLTSDEMKEKDSFVGFDFDTVWDISSDKNDGMPYLRNLPTQHSHSHTWGAWKFTLEPTTTTTGEVQRVCETNINHIEIVELPVLTDTTVWTAGAYVAPTCEVNGSQEYTCEYGTVIETIAATGHDWDDWVTIKEATYTKKGSEKRICKTDNSHIETREIATIVNAVGFAGGSGTQTDPYQVATPEQLNKVRDYLSSHFIQICDIDMTESTSEGGVYYNNGKGWAPIGNNSKKFTGSYDGAEYSITGLFCNAEYAGLFGYNNGGVVKNINLTGTIIGINAYAGGIVAYNYSKSVLTNCTFDGSVSSSSSYAGGITGSNYGTVTDCTNYANITSSNTYTGGVIGSNSSSSDITNCYNYGEVVSADFAGGIVGVSQRAQISNCGNEGNISSTTKTDTQVGYGGIAGRTNKNITQCYNKGNITATVTRSTSSSTSCAIGVGGIVGLATNGITVSDCFNTGKISSLYTCGDIVGSGSALKGWAIITTGESYQTVPESSVLTIKNCYNSSSNDTNGLYGYNASGFGWSGGYQENSCSYSNIITISALNSYNINADANTNVTQLTESEMKQKDKYVGFDFDTIWAISSSQNNGTPYLRGIGGFEPTYNMGDVNGDGYIDFIDAQVILKYDAGLITLTADQISRSDINNDGYVDFIDAQIILKFDAGLIDTLE